MTIEITRSDAQLFMELLEDSADSIEMQSPVSDRQREKLEKYRRMMDKLHRKLECDSSGEDEYYRDRFGDDAMDDEEIAEEIEDIREQAWNVWERMHELNEEVHGKYKDQIFLAHPVKSHCLSLVDNIEEIGEKLQDGGDRQ